MTSGESAGACVCVGAAAAWPEFRFGGSCVSHGTFGLNSVRADELIAGRPPRIGSGVTPTSGSASPWIGSGMTTVFVPPPARTRMYGPLASPERLSLEMPRTP